MGEILSGNAGAIAPSPSAARVTPTHAGKPIAGTTQASARRAALDAPLWGARRTPHPKGADTLRGYQSEGIFRITPSSSLAILSGMEADVETLRKIDEAAQLLRVTPVTVRAWVNRGRLMPVRLGCRVLLTERELQRFVDEGK